MEPEYTDSHSGSDGCRPGGVSDRDSYGSNVNLNGRGPEAEDMPRAWQELQNGLNVYPRGLPRMAPSKPE